MVKLARVVIPMALALSGCSVMGADPAMQKNPNYRAGYDDGCAAASTMGANPREAPFRDEDLYKGDEAYRAGWSSGFSTCRDQTTGSPLDNSGTGQLPGVPH